MSFYPQDLDSIEDFNQMQFGSALQGKPPTFALKEDDLVEGKLYRADFLVLHDGIPIPDVAEDRIIGFAIADQKK